MTTKCISEIENIEFTKKEIDEMTEELHGLDHIHFHDLTETIFDKKTFDFLNTNEIENFKLDGDEKNELSQEKQQNILNLFINNLEKGLKNLNLL